jgi:hypothetical protein
MSKRFVYIIVLTMMIASFSAVATPARAADSASLFAGLTVDADFTDMDDSSCVDTNITVLASKSIRIDLPDKTLERGAGINVFISQFNVCQGNQVLSVFGGTTIPSSTLRVALDLSSARLSSTTVQMTGESTPGTPVEFPVQVALKWNATGSAHTENSDIIFQDQSCTVGTLFKGRSRDATTTGSVIMDGSNLIQSSSDFARIGFAREGSFVIGCE